MQHRLQKILARAGIASRRSAEKLIEAGRVRVNGKTITELGARADPRSDRIEVDGKRIVAEDPVYILLHKPRGVMSTLNDPEGRPTVADLVESLPVRLFPVGRLDYQTSGALILTNDGDFTARMLHPRHHVPKTYLVKVKGEMTREDLALWREGVPLEDGPTLAAEANLSKRERGHTWFELILREGRNQQVRRMGETLGFPVVRLTRTAFAHLGIDSMRAGQWRFLSIAELRDLRSLYGVPKQIRAASAAHAELGKLQPQQGHGAQRVVLKKQETRPTDGRSTSDDRSGVRRKTSDRQGASKPVRAARGEASEKPTRRPVRAPRGEASEQPARRPVRAPRGEASEQPARRPVRAPRGEASEQPARRPVRAPRGKASDEPSRPSRPSKPTKGDKPGRTVDAGTRKPKQSNRTPARKPRKP
jgi:23S rRNA pseudouridine2605 synthase